MLVFCVPVGGVNQRSRFWAVCRFPDYLNVGNSVLANTFSCGHIKEEKGCEEVKNFKANHGFELHPVYCVICPDISQF